MRRTCVLILGLILLTTPAFVPAQKTNQADPKEKAESSTRVMDLEVHKPLPPDQTEMNVAFDSGTILGVLIALPGKNIVGIDRNTSKLLAFTDDKETDLTKARPTPGRFVQPSGIDNYFMKISTDRHRCAIRIRAVGVPVEGASKVRMKASVVLQCGSEEKSQEQKDVALKPGNKAITVGRFSVRADKGFGGGPAVMVTSDKPDVKSVTFSDANGKEIKNAKTGFFGGGFPKAQYQTYYSINQKADQATINITYYDKIEEVTLPTDVEVGVGF